MVKCTYWWAGITGDTRGTPSHIFHLIDGTHLLRLSIHNHFRAATECLNKVCIWSMNVKYSSMQDTMKCGTIGAA